jgi:hypothetical protein
VIDVDGVEVDAVSAPFAELAVLGLDEQATNARALAISGSFAQKDLCFDLHHIAA